VLSDDLQNLRDVYLDTITVPPPLLTVVAGKENDFGPIGKDMLDLDDVRFGALGAVHGHHDAGVAATS
jgi:hypothetical protein